MSAFFKLMKLRKSEPEQEIRVKRKYRKHRKHKHNKKDKSYYDTLKEAIKLAHSLNISYSEAFYKVKGRKAGGKDLPKMRSLARRMGFNPNLLKYHRSTRKHTILNKGIKETYKF